MYISKSNISSVVQDQNMLKEVLTSKQIEKGSQIRRQEQLLRAILFEAFPHYFNKCSQISVQHCLINFMSDKADNRASEYPWGTFGPPALATSTQWFQNTQVK